VLTSPAVALEPVGGERILGRPSRAQPVARHQVTLSVNRLSRAPASRTVLARRGAATWGARTAIRLSKPDRPQGVTPGSIDVCTDCGVGLTDDRLTGSAADAYVACVTRSSSSASTKAGWKPVYRRTAERIGMGIVRSQKSAHARRQRSLHHVDVPIGEGLVWRDRCRPPV
jgi:hypothetical protein